MKYFTLVLLAVGSVNLGCASLFNNVGGLEVVKDPEPVFLHLKGLQGHTELTRVNSRTVVKEEKNGKVETKDDKKVNFDVKSEILLVDPGQAHIHVLAKTVRKVGEMDLRDLALPRLNEEIKFVFYPNSEVFKVEGDFDGKGDFPKTSIFYIPPVSLPIDKVSVGDTWEMKRVWLTAKNRMPVKIHLTSIFKNLVKCGKNITCADIELDGFVDLPTLDKTKVNVKSFIKGRLLFALETGTVIWSKIRNQEKMTFSSSIKGDGSNDNIVHTVTSCTSSVVIKPVELNFFKEESDCDPYSEVPFVWKGL